MIATQTGACYRRCGQARGDARVYLGSKAWGVLTALAAIVALSGCSNLDWDSSPWFRKPLDLTGRNSGYAYSDLEEARLQRPISPNDLIEPNGSCPPQAAPAAPAAPPAPSNQAASPAPPPEPQSTLGEGVGLGMSECEVVYRAGQPTNIQLGKSPNGDRTAVLTFQSGPRPGIYRFQRGRLVEMDELPEASSPPPQAAKKKPAKTKKPPATNPA